MRTNHLLSIVLLFLLLSCNKDENNQGGQYSKGVFVVNQGIFQSGTGTITFHNYQDTIKDVFTKENPGQILGNVAQSMIRHDNMYFIAVNNADKVVVCDASTFKYIGEIKNIALPRYFASNGTKLYVSSWGADFKSGNVFEINTKTLTIAATIKTGGAPETLLLSGDKLYAAVSTVAEKSKSLLVIDTKTNTVLKKIETSDNPTHLVSDKAGTIWVLCGGNVDWTNPALSTTGALVKIKNDVVETSYKLDNGANGLVMDKKGERMYFLMSGKVFVHDIADQIFEKESVYDGFFYALGYDTLKDRLYLADAGNFQTDGSITHINLTTKSTSRYKSGIIPGFFYFAD